MNSDKYVLQEVTTPALEREWLDLPKRIYKGNRNWVCPLDVDIREVFDPAKNDLFADGEAIRWVARDARGELFYIMKNSWGTGNPYGGMVYMAESYLRLKTVAVVMPADVAR